MTYIHSLVIAISEKGKGVICSSEKLLHRGCRGLISDQIKDTKNALKF